MYTDIETVEIETVETQTVEIQYFVDTFPFNISSIIILTVFQYWNHFPAVKNSARPPSQVNIGPSQSLQIYCLLSSEMARGESYRDVRWEQGGRRIDASPSPLVLPLFCQVE